MSGETGGYVKAVGAEAAERVREDRRKSKEKRKRRKRKRTEDAT